eukprot:5935807-Prymnesium_polylepis.2
MELTALLVRGRNLKNVAAVRGERALLELSPVARYSCRPSPSVAPRPIQLSPLARYSCRPSPDTAVA